MQYKKYLRFFPLTLTSWCRPVMDFMSKSSLSIKLNKSLKLKNIYYTSKGKGIRRTASKFALKLNGIIRIARY